NWMAVNWEQVGAGSIAIGLLLGVIMVPWLVLASIRAKLGRTPWKRVRPILLLVYISVLLTSAPIAINSVLTRVLDLGPLESVVQNERHITLTGWDRKDYSILKKKLDAVVIQMANSDVTDETLTFLSGMSLLRELDVSSTGITDSGLATIANLPKLESLRLKNTRISDDGFRKHLFGKTTLMNLDLTGTEVASKTVREWKKLNENRKALK
ncbi:MAG: hypothetical protein FJ267_20260, partial [Planctomycetes bacterium]|nr:hypothetical protein [Planctomycetota bacterium]